MEEEQTWEISGRTVSPVSSVEHENAENKNIRESPPATHSGEFSFIRREWG